MVAGVLAGQVAAGARLLRWLEDDDPRGRVALGQVYAHTGRAHLVGVTGPGGARGEIHWTKPFVGRGEELGALLKRNGPHGRTDRLGDLAVDKIPRRLADERLAAMELGHPVVIQGPT